MRQIRVTSETFRTPGDDPTIPDAYVDPKDLQELRKLAGIDTLGLLKPYSPEVVAENPSIGASEKSEYQKKNNVKPGTDEWFKLWFSKPYLTGENPTPKKP